MQWGQTARLDLTCFKTSSTGACNRPAKCRAKAHYPDQDMTIMRRPEGQKSPMRMWCRSEITLDHCTAWRHSLTSNVTQLPSTLLFRPHNLIKSRAFGKTVRQYCHYRGTKCVLQGRTQSSSFMSCSILVYFNWPLGIYLWDLFPHEITEIHHLLR